MPSTARRPMTRNWPLPWQNSQKEARPMKLDQVNHIPQRDGYGQGLLDLCAARGGRGGAGRRCVRLHPHQLGP